MKSHALHEAFLSASAAVIRNRQDALRSAYDAVHNPKIAAYTEIDFSAPQGDFGAPDAIAVSPNYRAFCIAVLELEINMTPELVRALAKRYGLVLDDGTENPAL